MKFSFFLESLVCDVIGFILKDIVLISEIKWAEYYVKLDTNSRVPEYTIFHALGDFVNDKNTREKYQRQFFFQLRKKVDYSTSITRER